MTGRHRFNGHGNDVMDVHRLRATRLALRMCPAVVLHGPADRAGIGAAPELDAEQFHVASFLTGGIGFPAARHMLHTKMNTPSISNPNMARFLMVPPQ